MQRAFMLVHTEKGTAVSVAATMRGLPGVDRADVVTGAYDVIAVASGPTVRSLQTETVRAVEEIAGAVRAVLCPVGSHEALWDELLELVHA